MPFTNSFFIKDESSFSISDSNVGDFLGAGMKISCENCGSMEGMIAFKSDKKSHGGFGELKYTTPSMCNFSVESRNRYNLGTSTDSFASRLALKYSHKEGNFNMYGIAGYNLKVPLEGNDKTTIKPMALGGIGYNLTKKFNAYVEYDTSNSLYLGGKITF